MGQGSFGRVYLVVDENTGKMMAEKKVSITGPNTNKEVREISRKG